MNEEKKWKTESAAATSDAMFDFHLQVHVNFHFHFRFHLRLTFALPSNRIHFWTGKRTWCHLQDRIL